MHVSQKSKGFHTEANLCSQSCLYGPLLLYNVPRETVFLTSLEWKHGLTECSSREIGSRKDRYFSIRFDSHDSVPFLSQNGIRKQLPAESSLSWKTASQNEKSEWGGSSAVDEGFGCSVNVCWLGNPPDCVQAPAHSRKHNGLATGSDVTQRRLFTLIPAGVSRGDRRPSDGKSGGG